MLVIISVAISLLIMLASSFKTIYSLIKSDSITRLRIIRNFKKGTFATLYIAAFPLYICAYYSEGLHILKAVAESFSAMVKTALLEFDFDVLSPLMKENPLFKYTTILLVVLTAFNTLMFTLSIFYRKMVNRFRLWKISNLKKDLVFILGYNDKSRTLLHSMKTDANILISGVVESEDDKEEIYALGGAYISPLKKITVENMKKLWSFYKTNHLTIIVQEENREENLYYSVKLCEVIEKIGQDIHSLSLERGVDVFVFVDDTNDSMYSDLEKRSRGALHCVSKYDVIAQRFTRDFTLASLAFDSVDTEKAVLHEGVEISVLFIGFGRSARRIFRTFAENNQFMRLESGEPTLYPVNYHIFDKNNIDENIDYNNNFNYYKRWSEKNRDNHEYYPLPPVPANINTYTLDINDRDFIEKIKATLPKCKTSYKAIVISLGDDMTSLDMVEKVSDNLIRWKEEKKTKIFVRIHSSRLSDIIRNKKRDVEVIPFGDESSVYEYENIVRPQITTMALDRHICYTLENIDKESDKEELVKLALEKWIYKWDSVQRESNIYSILSIRAKLQLLGYDVEPEDSSTPDASDSFIADYTRANPIVVCGKTNTGKDVVDYSGEYNVEGTPRRILAELEHQRWNAYHIFKGFIPASKNEFLTEEKSELMRQKKHINLTTFAGLSEFEKDNKTEVIKYDYQLMDDALWLLSRNGYKIVKIKD